jgi:hypothetical protein
MAGLDAVGLLAAGDRCGGVWVISRTRGAAARTIAADLVVDAMGVGSRLSCWLADTWHASVPTERSEAAFCYVSQRYRLPSWTPAAVRREVSPDRRYDWMIAAVEGGDHVVTVRGPHHGLQSVDLDQFEGLVSTMLAPDLAAAVRSGRPTGGLSFYTRFALHRRRFDRALGLPDGLLALGESLHGTDPLLGVALSDALIQADLLEETLHGIAGHDPSRRSSLTGRYFDAAFAENRRSHTHDTGIMLADGLRRTTGRGPSS